MQLDSETETELAFSLLKQLLDDGGLFHGALLGGWWGDTGELGVETKRSDVTPHREKREVKSTRTSQKTDLWSGIAFFEQMLRMGR